MASIVHTGQTLRHKTEKDWPTVTVGRIVTEDLPSFAGKPLAPYAYVEWADEPGVYTAMNLATLQREWEDTGV